MKWEEFQSEYIGDIGIFQVLIVLMTGLSTFIGNEAIANNFIGGYQEHWCAIPELQDVPHYRQKQIAIPLTDEGEYDTCYAYKLNYSQYTMTDFYTWNASDHVTDDVMPCTDWVYDQSDYVSTISSEWNLVCDESWKVSFISTMIMAGYLVGSIVSGICSDRFGRVATSYVFLIIRIIAEFGASYAPNYAIFVTCRFLIGVGMFSNWLVNYIYAAETSGGKYRTITTQCVYLFHCVGYPFVPIYAYFIRDYVLLQLVFAYPILFLLVGFAIMPESPRWLLTKGKWDRAKNSLRKMASINGKVYPEDFDLKTIETRPESVKASSGSPWKLFLGNGQLFLRLTIICAIWFTVSLMYWAMSFNSGTLSGNIYLNTLLLGVVEIPAIIVAYFTLNWPPLGRKLTTGGSMLISSLTSFITIPFIVIGAGNWATAMSLLGKFFATMCFSSVYLYSAELLPTEVRNGGVGFASLCARVSGMAAPFIGGPLAEVWAPLPSIIFGTSSLIVGGLCIWLLPETLGKKMPETVEELIESLRASAADTKKKYEYDDSEIKNGSAFASADINKSTVADDQEMKYQPPAYYNPTLTNDNSLKIDNERL